MLAPEAWLALLRVVVGAWFLKAVWTKLSLAFAWGVLPYPTVSPRFIEKIVAQVGRRVDESVPMVDAALGVTVCCSAGDDGSSDIRDPRRRDGRPHVDFPASSPFALACGGTTLNGSGAAIDSEVVWNDGRGATGGGVSNVFARPPYQAASGASTT